MGLSTKVKFGGLVGAFKVYKTARDSKFVTRTVSRDQSLDLIRDMPNGQTGGLCSKLRTRAFVGYQDDGRA